MIMMTIIIVMMINAIALPCPCIFRALKEDIEDTDAFSWSKSQEKTKQSR